MFYFILLIKILLLSALICSVAFYILSTIRGINIDFYWFVTRFTPIFAVAIVFSVWNRHIQQPNATNTNKHKMK